MLCINAHKLHNFRNRCESNKLGFDMHADCTMLTPADSFASTHLTVGE